jgi:hypothetical protein
MRSWSTEQRQCFGLQLVSGSDGETQFFCVTFSTEQRSLSMFRPLDSTSFGMLLFAKPSATSMSSLMLFRIATCVTRSVSRDMQC